MCSRNSRTTLDTLNFTETDRFCAIQVIVRALPYRRIDRARPERTRLRRAHAVYRAFFAHPDTLIGRAFRFPLDREFNWRARNHLLRRPLRGVTFQF